MRNTTSESQTEVSPPNSELFELTKLYGEQAVLAAKDLSGSQDAEKLETVLSGYYLGSEDTFDEYFGEYFWHPSNQLGGCVPDELKTFVDVKGYFQHLIATGDIITRKVNGKTHAFFWDWSGI